MRKKGDHRSSRFRIRSGNYLFPLLYGVSLVVTAAPPPFSATLYQRSPHGVVQEGRLYVDHGRTRSEGEINGERQIQIIDRDNARHWQLFPRQRSYQERHLSRPVNAPDEHNPCKDLHAAHCQRLGEESLNGVLAIAWQMTLLQAGKTLHLRHWIDPQRGLLLRSESSSGERSEMKLVAADEQLAGRRVERWELILWSDREQHLQRSIQWYDPQLQLVIREELPGGYLRELRNIQIAEQPPELFTPPSGWQRLPPTASPQPDGLQNNAR